MTTTAAKLHSMNAEITVGELKRVLALASDDATIPEALEELAEADRRDDEALAHGERQGAYHAYLARRRERYEAVQGAYHERKEATIAAGPVSRERVHAVSAEAADRERSRFEIREPALSFEEWLDAGSPEIHEIRGVRAKLTGAGP
jgi:hypothetical protein